MPTITKAPSPQAFATAWTRGFAAAVRSEAGRDGRLSLREAKRIAEQDGHLAQFGDNAVNYLEKTGQKSVSVNKLIGKGHDYAAAVADRVTTNNDRVSLVEARNLPDDIRGDFFALRGKALRGKALRGKALRGKALRGKDDPGAVEAACLSGNALTKAFDKAVETEDGYGLTYTSEGDYNVLPVSADNAGNRPVNGETVMDLFEDLLTGGIFADTDDYRAELTAETFSGAESKAWLKEQSTYDPTWMDDWYKKESEGFARVLSVVDANLEDVRVVKVGPKDDDGSLAVDHGTYAYFIVGKTDAGEIAGVHFGSAET